MLKVKKLLKKLVNSSEFVVTTETQGTIGNTEPKAYTTLNSVKHTKVGYKPLGMVGVYHDSRYFIDKYHHTSISGSSITVSGYSTNWDTIARTGNTVYVNILWQKLG